MIRIFSLSSLKDGQHPEFLALCGAAILLTSRAIIRCTTANMFLLRLVWKVDPSTSDLFACCFHMQRAAELYERCDDVCCTYFSIHFGAGWVKCTEDAVFII